MINNVLNTDGFYFCTDFDLTHTLQRLANTSPDFQEMSLLERVSLLLISLFSLPNNISLWSSFSLMGAVLTYIE